MKWPYTFSALQTISSFYTQLKGLFSDVGDDMQEQKNRVDNLITNNPQPSEVVDARTDGDGTVYGTLRDRLNGKDSDTAAQLAEMETQANHDADKEFIENMIQTAFSGMGEPYDTLANLKVAYPEGVSPVPGGYLKPHVVTADGNWYFYSTIALAWTSGGVYQSTQIGDESVTNQKLKDKSITVNKTDFISYTHYPDRMNWENISLGTVLNLDGTTASSTGYWTSDFEKVKPSTSYCLSKDGNPVSFGILRYYNSSKQLITGVYAQNTNVFTTPSNCYFVKFDVQYYSASGTGSSAGITAENIDEDYIISKAILQESSLPQPIGYDYLSPNQIKTPRYWAGKKWLSYGDSVTEMGLWQKYVSKELCIDHINFGQGGTFVAQHTYSNGTYSFYEDARINTLDTDADLVTIMGGTNDFGGIEIGDFSYPFDVTKFKGALCETIRKIKIRCPNALIVIMSNVGGRGDSGVVGTIPITNNLGLTAQDYAIASKDTASFMSMPFVDVWSCGINCFNRLQYISDSVHPNSDGGKLIARTVIKGLKDLAPTE